MILSSIRGRLARLILSAAAVAANDAFPQPEFAVAQPPFDIICTDFDESWEQSLREKLAFDTGHVPINASWANEALVREAVELAQVTGSKVVLNWSPWHANDGAKIPGYAIGQPAVPIGVEPSLGHFLWASNRAREVKLWLDSCGGSKILAGHLCDCEVWNIESKSLVSCKGDIETAYVNFSVLLDSVFGKLPQYWYGMGGWGGTQQNNPKRFFDVKMTSAMGLKQATFLNYTVTGVLRGSEINSEFAATFGPTAASAWKRSAFVTLSGDYSSTSIDDSTGKNGWDKDADTTRGQVVAYLEDMTNIGIGTFIVYVSTHDDETPDEFMERMGWMIEFRASFEGDQAP